MQGWPGKSMLVSTSYWRKSSSGNFQERRCTSKERSRLIPHPGHEIQRLLLLAAALAFTSVGVHAQDPNTDIYGTWRIKAMIGGGAVGSLNQRQVEKIIGKIAIISAERFEFNG